MTVDTSTIYRLRPEVIVCLADRCLTIKYGGTLWTIDAAREVLSGAYSLLSTCAQESGVDGETIASVGQEVLDVVSSLISEKAMTALRPPPVAEVTPDVAASVEALTVFLATRRIADMASLSRPLAVVTPTEALVLLPGMTPSCRRTALRLFVSGLADDDMEVFAPLTWSDSHTAFGGTPGVSDLESLGRKMQAVDAASQEPIVLVREGHSNRHEWIRLDRRAREVVQQEHESTIQLRGHEYNSSTATYVVPNLRLTELAERRYGFGLADTPKHARTIAAAEAIERFAAGDVRDDAVVESSAGEFKASGDAYLSPDQILSFSSTQYSRHDELVPYSPSDRLSWTRGESIATGLPIWVPAEFTFYPYSHRSIGSRGHLGWATSSGVAAGRSRRDALVRAWHELVERHGFMDLWLRRDRTRRMVLPSTGPAATLVEDMIRQGVEVALHDISHFGSFAVLAACRTKHHSLALGAAAGWSPESATKKALLEASTSLWRWQDRTPRKFEATEVETPGDHEELYLGNPDLRREYLFLFDADVGLPWPPPIDDAERALPPDLVAVDLTSDLTRPVHVMRCLLPRCIPITFGFDREPLGLPMALEAVESRGEVPETPLLPHPFA